MFEFSNLISFTLAFMVAVTGTAQGQVSATPTQTDARQGNPGQAASGNSAQETKPTATTEPKEGEVPGLLQLPEAPESGNPMTDAELESYIQNALNRDPALGHAGLRAMVAGDRIELSGNVARSKEKQTAGRIAQSFAGSRKVLNQIAISGGAAVPAPATHSPEGGAPHNSKPENRGLVTPNPGPDKAPPPPLP
jgi:uncharacterized iron-regulated membrane protein